MYVHAPDHQVRLFGDHVSLLRMDQDRITRILKVKEIFHGILHEEVSVFHFDRKPCQRSRIFFRMHKYTYLLSVIQKHSYDGIADLSGRTGY